MSKVIKVNHVVLTLALSPVAEQNGGENQASIDKKVNDRLAEGYDDVVVIPLRTNFDERNTATHVVNQYIFKKYQEQPVVAPVKAEKVEKAEKVAKAKE